MFDTPHLHSDWVNRELASLSLTEKLAQLLVAHLNPEHSTPILQASLGPTPTGGYCLIGADAKDVLRTTAWLQKREGVPPLIGANMEHGAGRIIRGATVFPDALALAAVNDEKLALKQAVSMAREARAHGISWSFSPVVDLQAHPHSPAVNTRGLGDCPERVIRLAENLIRGMQKNGLCATARHFPGDGFDDRDQHVCTTTNPLSMDAWHATSGRIFKAVIDAGVHTIMTGHIALPACDPGTNRKLGAPPATLSSRILLDLLRCELGFKGLILAGPVDMGGITSQGSHVEILSGAINAGCDMLLFSNPSRDLPLLQRAVQRHILSEERIDESVRRVLALKEHLQLHQPSPSPALTDDDRTRHAATARTISRRAVTVVRDRDSILPITLGRGRQILSIQVKGASNRSLATIDECLRSSGADLTRMIAGEADLWISEDDVNSFDCILVHLLFCPTRSTARVRPGGMYMRTLSRLLSCRHPRVVLISYGSPYHGHDFPHLPTLINAYSSDTQSQKAVFDVLQGKLVPTATSPVCLDAPATLSEAWARETACRQAPNSERIILDGLTRNY